MCEVIVLQNGNLSSYDLFVNIGTILGALAALYCMIKRLRKISLVAVAAVSLAVVLLGISGFFSTFVRQMTTMDFGTVDVLMEKLASNAGNHFSGRVLAMVLFYALLYRILCWLLRKRQEISTVWKSLDGVAFFIVIQHFFNRVACLMNGCCYGIPYNGIFSIRLPYSEVDYSLFPVQILEMAAMLVLFFVLCYRWRQQKPLFGLTVLGFGIIIFIAEFFTDQRGALLFMGVNFIQIVGILLCLCGVYYWYRENKNEKDKG